MWTHVKHWARPTHPSYDGLHLWFASPVLKTLLFHGALQLSQALNGVYKATEAQLIKARNSLSLYGQVLGLLGKEVSQGQDAAQELRASLLEMQVGTAVGVLWGG